jgi:small basic protein
MIIPFVGLLIGLLAGWFVPVSIPAVYSSYVGVAILGALDSIFGGISANLQKNFDFKIFISGFFGNAILAVIFVYIGDKLGIQLYLVVLFAFGNRVFLNFAIIRRIFIKNFSLKSKKKKYSLHKFNIAKF